MERTINELKDIFDEVKSREHVPLVRKIIVYKSPVSNKLEHRVGYFQFFVEADMWVESITKVLDQLGIESEVYTYQIKVTPGE